MKKGTKAVNYIFGIWQNIDVFFKNVANSSDFFYKYLLTILNVFYSLNSKNMHFVWHFTS